MFTYDKCKLLAKSMAISVLGLEVFPGEEEPDSLKQVK